MLWGFIYAQDLVINRKIKTVFMLKSIIFIRIVNKKNVY
jgi:hypothetical protein